MENLINKWKKLINKENEYNTSLTFKNQTDSDRQSPKNSQLVSSLLKSERKKESTERSNKFSKSSRSLTNSKNNSLSTGKKSNDSKDNIKDHKLIISINKIIKYIENNEDVDLSKIIVDLNSVIDLYISQVNDNSINSFKNDEKELILKTKCETAEKMIKDYELKYLTAEKEKNKYKKIIDELNMKLDEMKENNENLYKKNETLAILENNNKVLLKTNDYLNNQLNEMKLNQEKIIKNFESEVSYISDRLDKYKSLLNKIQNKEFNISYYLPIHLINYII